MLVSFVREITFLPRGVIRAHNVKECAGVSKIQLEVGVLTLQPICRF